MEEKKLFQLRLFFPCSLTLYNSCINSMNTFELRKEAKFSFWKVRLGFLCY